MRKKILLKNSAGNRVLLTGEFFQWINSSGYSVFADTLFKEEFGSYLGLFNNIQTLVKKENQQFDLVVEFTETTKGIPENLIYPILNASSESETKDHIIPVEFNPPRNEYHQPFIEDAIDFIEKKLSEQDLKDKNILISCGPTAEDIDPVRFLTNRSTGKMGIALARAAFIRGAHVRLVIGPSTQRCPVYMQTQSVRNAENMQSAIFEHLEWYDFFISAAAVADYTPVKINKDKLKKNAGNLILELKRTADILTSMGQRKRPNQKIIGFSVETQNLVENSRKKMIRKNLDAIIANNPLIKGAGFAVDTNQVEIITNSGVYTINKMSKLNTAHKILDHILKLDNA